MVAILSYSPVVFQDAYSLSQQSPADHGRAGLVQLSLSRARVVSPASLSTRTLSGKVNEDANHTPKS